MARTNASRGGRESNARCDHPRSQKSSSKGGITEGEVSYLSSFLVLDFITNEFCAQPCRKMTVPLFLVVVGADDDDILVVS